ncbi:bifunctional DNA primase/polymerase [Streptomyces sp. LX-29]|nr:bifunctional DNA primase/polymerase [Streptomyces sp. LX-29]
MCRATWAANPRTPYSLHTGRLFDVVEMDQRIGLETFDQLDRYAMPMGPVIVDWAEKKAEFFLPARSRERFETAMKNETAEPPEYRYLDEGSVIVVPGPMPLSGDRYTWLCTPRGVPEYRPARIHALVAMFVAAAALVARADRYGEEQKRLAETTQSGRPEQDPLRA